MKKKAFLVTQRQMLVTCGMGAPLEHSLSYNGLWPTSVFFGVFVDSLKVSKVAKSLDNKRLIRWLNKHCFLVGNNGLSQAGNPSWSLPNNKLCCYTSQLKYVFGLEENVLCQNSLIPQDKQNSLTPQGSNNLNFRPACDQVMLLKATANL